MYQDSFEFASNGLPRISEHGNAGARNAPNLRTPSDNLMTANVNRRPAAWRSLAAAAKDVLKARSAIRQSRDTGGRASSTAVDSAQTRNRMVGDDRWNRGLVDP